MTIASFQFRVLAQHALASTIVNTTSLHFFIGSPLPSISRFKLNNGGKFASLLRLVKVRSGAQGRSGTTNNKKGHALGHAQLPSSAIEYALRARCGATVNQILVATGLLA
jgi:hypothetical protein